MKVSRFDWDGSDPRGLAAELRALQPPLAEVGETVAEIIAAVEAEGDEAVLRYEQQFGVRPGALRVSDGELEAAVEELEGALREAMLTAIENLAHSYALGAVPEDLTGHMIQLGGRPGEAPDDTVAIRVRQVPVAAAGVYAPGGRAAYPSTAIMCCVPAREAGVKRIAVASPAADEGKANPTVLAAAAMSGATEAYAMGGAQGIAALALGTESVEPVDMIAGPGNRYVTEAKRQLVGRVGIDGIAGPSELMVIADGSVDPRLLALDLCAQGEHGDDGLLVVCVPDQEQLDEIERLTTELAASRPSVMDPPLALVTAPGAEPAVELADALAPEHLQLACADAASLSDGVRYAGCVFLGRDGATAFGDYAAGSNHVLPTGGAGRFQGPLGPDAFRRRLRTVGIGDAGVRELAPVVATLAEAEGFPVHGESATARAESAGQAPNEDAE